MLGYFNIIAIFGHPVSMYRISRLFYLFFFSFSVITFSSFSQKLVSGKVYSSNDSEPLVGVTIMVKGKDVGTISSIDGSFSLNLSEEDNEIVASFVGFISQEVSVGNQSMISIYMDEDITELGEVVITALGFKEERDKLGLTASKVEGDQISRSAETGLINGMAGKASGLRVTRSSGDPGAGSHIQIRGPVTITSSLQPLIILDGVPIDNSTCNNKSASLTSSKVLLNDSINCVGNFLINPTVSPSKNGKFPITTFLVVVSNVAKSLSSAKTSDLLTVFISVDFPTFV